MTKRADSNIPVLEFKKPGMRGRRSTAITQPRGPLSPAITRSRRRASVYITSTVQGFGINNREAKPDKSKSPKTVKSQSPSPKKAPKQQSKSVTPSLKKEDKARTPSPKKTAEKPKPKSASSKEARSMTQLKGRARSRSQSPNKIEKKNMPSPPKASRSQGKATPLNTKAHQVTPAKKVVTPRQTRQTPHVKPRPVASDETLSFSRKRASPDQSSVPQKSKSDSAIVSRTPKPTPRTRNSKVNVSTSTTPKVGVVKQKSTNEVTPIPAVRNPSKTVVKATPKTVKLSETPVEKTKPVATATPKSVKVTSSKLKQVTKSTGTPRPSLTVTPVVKVTAKVFTATPKATNKSIYETPPVQKSVKSVRAKKVLLTTPKTDSPGVLPKSGKRKIIKTPFKAAKMLGKNESPTGNTPIKAARVLGKVQNVPTPVSGKKIKLIQSQEIVPLTSTPLKLTRKRMAEAPPPVSEIRVTKILRSSNQDESVFPAPNANSILDMATIKESALSLDNIIKGETIQEISADGDTSGSKVDEDRAWWGWTCQIL